MNDKYCTALDVVLDVSKIAKQVSNSPELANFFKIQASTLKKLEPILDDINDHTTDPEDSDDLADVSTQLDELATIDAYCSQIKSTGIISKLIRKIERNN